LLGAAEREYEAGEVVAEGRDAVDLAADVAGQGHTGRVVVGREPAIQELQELGELSTASAAPRLMFTAPVRRRGEWRW
jgi:hypothetical protein